MDLPKLWRNLGPGFLVTAAFIGPGTITTASKAGAEFGFALLWALVFSVGATIVLQEMSARLGLATRRGLGEAIRSTFASPPGRGLCVGLVVVAIAVGNAAFQTGNIVGAAAGLETLTGIAQPTWAIGVGLATGALLWFGVYRILERVLISLVVLMSVVFLVTALLVRPDFAGMLQGIAPRVPEGSLLTIVALIGTTVVPYNLFLHASAVQQKWPASLPLDQALRAARRDTSLSISIGGLITLALMATASAAFFHTHATFASPADIAQQLGPLFGPAAEYLFAVGLLAAGLTSAITAPLAAAFATAGVLGWQCDLQNWRLRLVWGLIVAVGTTFAALAHRPLEVIVLAQAANGILLPLVAVFLLVVMNRRALLGRHANGSLANLLGGAVVLIATALGAIQLLKAVGAVN